MYFFTAQTLKRRTNEFIDINIQNCWCKHSKEEEEEKKEEEIIFPQSICVSVSEWCFTNVNHSNVYSLICIIIRHVGRKTTFVVIKHKFQLQCWTFRNYRIRVKYMYKVREKIYQLRVHAPIFRWKFFFGRSFWFLFGFFSGVFSKSILRKLSLG